MFSVKKKFQRSSRRASIVVTSLLVLSALSACSKSDSDMSTLEKVQKQGFATYGLEAQYEPFGFRDESNNIVGYDIDLGNAIGEELGIEMRPVDTGWATVIQTMIDGGAERVDFGVTYAEQASAFLVRADDTLKEQGELGGRKVAAGEGTPSVKMLEDNATQYGITYDGEIQQFGDDATAYEALAIGRIDAYATSYVSLVPLMKKRPGEFKAVMFRPDGWPDFYACMAFRQDDDTLRNAIDEAILKLKKDGTLAKLQIKWFGVEMKTLDTAPEL